MPIQDLQHDFDVVLGFCDSFLAMPRNFANDSPEDVKKNKEYACNLLHRSWDAFQDDSDNRTLCEEYVKELLQFSRALVLYDRQNPQWREREVYRRDYPPSIAALKRIISVVRLHFLLLDLTAIVESV